MILNPDAVRGLTRAYGHTGKRLWVYRDDTNDLQLLPREPGDRPPKQHPQHPTYRRIGLLDLQTGQIKRPRRKKKPKPTRTWYGNVYLACEILAGFLLAGVILIATIIAMAAGGGGRTRVGRARH